LSLLPFLLHQLAPLKLDMGRWVEQPRQTVPVWVNVSVVTVNRTKTAVFCYLKAASSTRRFNGTVFARFYFLIAYTMSIMFYLLLDHVIRSSAINLHLAFDLGFAHHRCQMSVQRCVWSLVMTLGEIQTNHGPWTNPPRCCWPSDCFSPCSHVGTVAHLPRHASAAAAGSNGSRQLSRNFLSRFK